MRNTYHEGKLLAMVAFAIAAAILQSHAAIPDINNSQQLSAQIKNKLKLLNKPALHTIYVTSLFSLRFLMFFFFFHIRIILHGNYAE